MFAAVIISSSSFVSPTAFASSIAGIHALFSTIFIVGTIIPGGQTSVIPFPNDAHQQQMMMIMEEQTAAQQQPIIGGGGVEERELDSATADDGGGLGMPSNSLVANKGSRDKWIAAKNAIIAESSNGIVGNHRRRNGAQQQQGKTHEYPDHFESLPIKQRGWNASLEKSEVAYQFVHILCQIGKTISEVCNFNGKAVNGGAHNGWDEQEAERQKKNKNDDNGDAALAQGGEDKTTARQGMYHNEGGGGERRRQERQQQKQNVEAARNQRRRRRHWENAMEED